MRARKRFGQNFLTDGSVIDKIVASINPRTTDSILEIGPGHGAITSQLVKSGCELSVVEIDRDLVAELSNLYPGQLQIYSEDILKFDYSNLPRPIRIVGNLPYNITTPLLFKLFEQENLYSDLTFMLQLEVVNRITAAPSNSNYGRLSIMSQYYCDAEKLFEVPPQAFTPAPKVKSAIIRLTPKTQREVEVVDIDLMEQLLIAAFSKRRKTIRNALKGYLSADDLSTLNIDASLRPENLSPTDYARCSNFITASNNGNTTANKKTK